jgi:hypothetical protein
MARVRPFTTPSSTGMYWLAAVSLVECRGPRRKADFTGRLKKTGSTGGTGCIDSRQRRQHV